MRYYSKVKERQSTRQFGNQGQRIKPKRVKDSLSQEKLMFCCVNKAEKVCSNFSRATDWLADTAEDNDVHRVGSTLQLHGQMIQEMERFDSNVTPDTPDKCG
ncbi:hypothetical protein Tco_0212065 [Tanacetum coccineum]